MEIGLYLEKELVAALYLGPLTLPIVLLHIYIFLEALILPLYGQAIEIQLRHHRLEKYLSLLV